jgi:transposase InsO family protein
MPWKEVTTMFLKKEFIERMLNQEKPFSHLCEEYNISRTAGYQLWKRYQAEGMNALKVRSRTPHHSPNKTSKMTEEKILSVRAQHPAWGARKIRAYLQKRENLSLPVPSTITNILKRHGLVPLEDSLKRKALGRFEREQANELWQMDFKGKFKLENQQSCYPLTLLDDHSRFSLCLKACANEQRLTVQKQLKLIFQSYGLPWQINVDNGNPWGHSCGIPHTKLTVWLMLLGVRVTHSRPRHPPTNGKEERFHQTLKKEVLNHFSIKNFTHAQQLFDRWRDTYNYERPHEALEMKVPADRYQPSARQLPNRLPPLDYPINALLRKVRGNGYISYRDREYLVGEAFQGYYVEVRIDEVNNVLDLYFGKNKIYTYELL